MDLVVLAYHRWIEGDLLTRYAGTMINQHPADLSDLDDSGARRFTGKDPVRSAMAAGRTTTRTSCFAVDETRDGGAVLAMGPQVPVQGRQAAGEPAPRRNLSGRLNRRES
ncbi:formyltransferase family protein [Sphaerimonospora thailandensis]|uniref:Formyl transferase N-terminal domain-containing protein n=1 Tax=Sphaerimonospora thailandensis TaxID=795644 RepID=A0A8J3RCP1_9ACTN|nr:formyltransferase family protein [Sphaerimonospora thailandensis]GIH72578.1 hypothetical protein Mth01_48310 [Sphaerimonospora thailandensis]